MTGAGTGPLRMPNWNDSMAQQARLEQEVMNQHLFPQKFSSQSLEEHKIVIQKEYFTESDVIYSTSCKYAVLVLIELATREEGQPVPVKELSHSTGISRHFVAKLVQTLVKAGILNSKKGKGGGVWFARRPAQITIAEVVRAIDGEGMFQSCIFSLDPCDGTRDCRFRPVWCPLRNQILNFLENTTISEVASKITS